MKLGKVSLFALREQIQAALSKPEAELMPHFGGWHVFLHLSRSVMGTFQKTKKEKKEWKLNKKNSSLDQNRAKQQKRNHDSKNQNKWKEKTKRIFFPFGCAVSFGLFHFFLFMLFSSNHFLFTFSFFPVSFSSYFLVSFLFFLSFLVLNFFSLQLKSNPNFNHFLLLHVQKMMLLI